MRARSTRITPSQQWHSVDRAAGTTRRPHNCIPVRMLSALLLLARVRSVVLAQLVRFAPASLYVRLCPDIESCGYDGAGGVLNHMYSGFNGNTSLLPPTTANPNNIIEFDQSAYCK